MTSRIQGGFGKGGRKKNDTEETSQITTATDKEKQGEPDREEGAGEGWGKREQDKGSTAWGGVETEESERPQYVLSPIEQGTGWNQRQFKRVCAWLR